VLPEARLARRRRTPVVARGGRGAEVTTGMVGRGGRGGGAEHWSSRGARRVEGGGAFECFGAGKWGSVRACRCMTGASQGAGRGRIGLRTTRGGV
jgi:hypothetical protein